ncbi:hypothetical protein EXIGLDRAFT_845679 [Exidia glandulosa HHB12029]|uniref:Uncharacterized protein n=1 Tax=Exidia glandulosa HHB12029 TaxID=1314781 RepID=A0A165BBZ9_EXIGL|nr:hypothetical protein EXIGLDRAFT_845679 [Exidia glandulosa HHB12029]
MEGHDLSTVLPPEILRHFLQGFSFYGLLPILQVSSHWRAMALDHPNYWAHIRLHNDSSGAIQLFLIRILRTYCRPFKVYVSLSRSSPAFGTEVLPTIASNMERILSLYLAVNVSNSSDLFDLFNSLCHPAPLITALRLNLYTSSSPHWQSSPEYPSSLPVGLFAGVAPLLRSLSLTDVTVPSDLVPALTGVYTLTVGHGALIADGNFQDFLPQFPNLRRLHFVCPAESFDPVYRDNTRWATLEYVHASPSMLADPTLPLHVVKQILGYGVTPEEYSALLEHLRGPLDLAFEAVPEMHYVLMHMRERTSPFHERTICEGIRQWSDEYIASNGHPRPLPFTRIVTLTIPECLWQLACGIFPSMPSVKQLSLVLDEPDPLSPSFIPAPRCLPTPCLERLILRAGLGQPVIGFELLHNFLTYAIPTELSTLRVSLAGVFVKSGTAYGLPLLVFEQCTPEELVPHPYPRADIFYDD